jgi:hypothetical protein
VRRSSRFSAGASPHPQLEQRADLLRLDARHGEYRALEIVGVDEVEAVGTDGFLHRHVEHPLGGAIGPPNPSLRVDQQRRVGQPGRDGGEQRSIDGLALSPASGQVESSSRVFWATHPHRHAPLED